MIKTFLWYLLFAVMTSPIALADDVAKLKQDNARLQGELENLTLDRNNVLKQAKTFQREKEELVKKLEAINNATSGSRFELESLQKENSLLQSELDKLRSARQKDRNLHEEEKAQLSMQVQDAEKRGNSLVKMMGEYTPEKVDELVLDRNRLQEENKRMAKRVLDYETRLENLKKQVTPLQLDREELARIKAENRQLLKKAQYINKVESRNEQLVGENAEYREQVEILKAKFKEAVPGLAKSSRVAQKMMRENADMHFNLGTIFLNNKRYREAIEEYERVLDLRPNDPETHYNLGVLYDDFFKDREKALYHYQRYISINPKAPDAKRVESYILSLELEMKVR